MHHLHSVGHANAINTRPELEKNNEHDWAGEAKSNFFFFLICFSGGGVGQLAGSLVDSANLVAHSLGFLCYRGGAVDAESLGLF